MTTNSANVQKNGVVFAGGEVSEDFEDVEEPTGQAGVVLRGLSEHGVGLT